MEDNLEVTWRKSRYSGNGGGNCVEVGTATAAVAVRDTTDRGGVTLAFTAGAWAAFTAEVKHAD